MRLKNRRILMALVATGALTMAACGDDESTSTPASSAGGNGVDRAFVADMIPHHESAVAMAQIALKRGESSFVKELANDIVSSQTTEISTMRREDKALAAGGVMRGALGVSEHMMGMDHDIAALRSAGAFDRAFIEMMIPHHEGALVMAQVELDKGADPELKALAKAIRAAQEREIAKMREHLGESGESGDAGHGMGGSGHSG